MKVSVVDIGSNSVRLMMWADGKTLYKRLNTTRLGEGLSLSGKMTAQAIERTAQAIKDFKELAINDGAEKFYAFATAAVRSATNRNDFLLRVKQVCGVDVDVISGEEEAKIGLLGALGTGDGGIIDVGGASTEITVQKDGKKLYSKSVNIGTVRLFDLAGRDYSALEKVIEEKISDYGDIEFANMPMYGIGGTATTIASVFHRLKVYDPTIVDGTVVGINDVKKMAEKFTSLSVEEVKKVEGMEVRRADVIGGGCLLTYKIMQKLKLKTLTVSEKDNLEGYVLLKCGENEK
jgi:exopolyphosphatase/guanosine-5'-triphosphate,3'-diphosphate pyrophosphatase